MDQERIDRLAEHLRSLSYRARAGVRSGDGMAEAILDDPQSHVDALVAAGVLKLADSQVPGLYEVVQREPPHVHDWEIYCFTGGDATLGLRCLRCGNVTSAPNKLPIEVPA